MPDWYEWELAAAASGTQRDARSDPAWRQQILDWYARPAGDGLVAVEQGAANVYGLYDIHGVVWEWVQDFDSLLPADADPERFCGSGAQNLQEDTPQRLTELAHLRRTDPGRWTFASAAEPDARRIAALLGVHYRRLEDGSFDHSQIITLVDGEGRVVARTTRLIGDEAFEAKLRAITGGGAL